MLRLTAPAVIAAVSGGAGNLDVRSATIQFDSTQAPYCQVTLVCAAPSGAVVELIDPRKQLRVSLTVLDEADLFGGTPTSRFFWLYLRARSHDAAAGTLTITATSDEARLIDLGLLQATVKDWGKATVQQLVAAVLAQFGAVPTFGAADYAIQAGAASQSPGQSYWDFLDGTLQGGNLRLWCDELGAWHLDDKGTIQPGQLRLSYAETVTALTDAIDLTGDYYDSVVVRYSWVDASGNSQTAYDYAGPANPVRTIRIDFTSPPAVAGAARRLLRRVRGRGRTLTHEAVSRYDVVPGQALVATLPDGAPVQTGLVASVAFTLPLGRMVVTSREVSDTLPVMWAAQPAGTSWGSIPAGVAWTAYLALSWGSRPAGETWASEPAGVRWQEYGN